jgi:hypothetical protein
MEFGTPHSSFIVSRNFPERPGPRLKIEAGGSKLSTFHLSMIDDL